MTNNMISLGIKQPLLLNAVQHNKDHPITFQIPSQSERESIVVGSYAKVACMNERFWCLIVSRKVVNNVVLYMGRVNNHLVGKRDHGLAFNDYIDLCEDNVLAIA